MIKTDIHKDLSSLFNNLAAELDVPPSKYEEAKKRYDAVGNWLNDENSILAGYSPEIYPQGSFAYGTAVKPLGDEDYDVDAVCLLKMSESDIDQKQLKMMVGERLKENSNYLRMIDPPEGGRRCWTLKYADESKFHLDILPAILDDYNWLLAAGVPEPYAKHAICITDSRNWDRIPDWPKSNPRGYLDWFKDRMKISLEEGRKILAMVRKADVQKIPDYEVRTPLQRVIQLLKRHRDIRFNGDDDKPISIIITTLAAQAYNNENDVVEAFYNIIKGMRLGIQDRNGVLCVPNPVNPHENFADKWIERPRKAKAFFEWLDEVEKETKELLTEKGFKKIGTYIESSYGKKESQVVLEKYEATRKDDRSISRSSFFSSLKDVVPRFVASHCQKPNWLMAINNQYYITVTAAAYRNGFRTIHATNGFKHLPKNYSLKFTANTNVPRPFSVNWQVVNTGEEASKASQLRGGFYEGDYGNNLTRTESTLYSGQHWIECFIIKDDRCVARSGEFEVNID